MPVLSLGYLDLDVVDLDAWRNFLGNFVGLQEVDGPVEGAAHFRMDDYPPRILCRPAGDGGQGALRAVGFEVGNGADLAALVARLEEAGTAVEQGSDDDRAQRQVRDLVRFKEPGGNVIELFYGPTRHHEQLVSPVSGFVTGDQGMGHVIIKTPDVEASFRFFTEALGFEDRNSMLLPGGAEMYFLSTNPRQHSLGLVPDEGTGLLHLMVEGETLDDVGLALDRAEQFGVGMMQSLGRHTNDDMVSFYVWSPELHAVEFGWSGNRVQGPSSTYRISKGAYWGHKFTPPPAPPAGAGGDPDTARAAADGAT